MNRNDLIIKLRASFNNHIRPIRIKDRCELCGSEEYLILHHIDTFSNLLDETLEELGIDIYTEEFTDLEVKNINNIMLGKQLRSNMATLCDNCHKEVHKDGYIKARDKYKYKQPKEPNLEEIEMLENYLNKIEGKKLFDTEQQELNDLIINKLTTIKKDVDYRTNKLKSITIEKILMENLNSEYIVSKPKKESKGEMRGKRYIIINKKENSDIL